MYLFAGQFLLEWPENEPNPTMYLFAGQFLLEWPENEPNPTMYALRSDGLQAYLIWLKSR